ncbi:branched-chain amino acid ABC transporter substrate-binding protein [Chryseobacterium wangxinyae]|uniref:branched-chain amino acid ABC transporter substrate-binding protein n=1 Tax=Chryseobacterium sp. CY350 TaxID=2997336 RepID=UPI00226F50C7|nr:branched-chain amino acid ABC transporter substrate-binding protein [Chryseobacterium sp. CY350]MCY0977587.1 branched-chain amino acid ABC transporter substrate-binding protein [Chryseobacterium sp. CY350]WBZ95403.1 branched-chain amino acid ABC transporter substrate-binding protein [Chryseobacterium sp. CY350]
MPFDFFDGLGFIGDLISFLGSSSDSKSLTDKEAQNKKSKYIVEWWSGSLLLISAILLFLVFKNFLPAENLVQNLIVCSIIGLIISFVLFFALYHLGLYYFKSLFKLLLLSCSVILFSISIVLCIYFKSNLFIKTPSSLENSLYK